LKLEIAKALGKSRLAGKTLPMMKSISVVFPVYNEEAYVKATLEKALEVLPGIADDFEIIIVNDASTDNTRFLLQKYLEVDKRVKVISSDRNRKLGGTLKTGFKEASKELILYSDFDMPFDLREVKQAIEVMEKEDADVVSAYRTNREVDGIKRTVYSYIYNHLINYLLRLDLKDVNFSFKLFKRSILADITLESEGSFISVELLTYAKVKGYKITQFPVLYYPRTRGRSHLASIKVIIKIIKEMMGFYFAHIRPDLKNSYLGSLWSDYREKSLWTKFYISMRLRSCPFEAIEQYVPPTGKIVDLGCGIGLFSGLMHKKSPLRQITAMDWNPDRISCAKKAFGDKIDFLIKDLAEVSLDACGCIVILDVLYLLTDKKVEEVLLRCNQWLSSAGALLILEKDTKPRFKYFLLLIQEFFITLLMNLNRSRTVNLREKTKMINLINQCGFSVTVKYLHRGYPYPHVLYVCEKRK